jgi:hypothetical protein
VCQQWWGDSAEEITEYEFWQRMICISISNLLSSSESSNFGVGESGAAAAATVGGGGGSGNGFSSVLEFSAAFSEGMGSKYHFGWPCRAFFW